MLRFTVNMKGENSYPLRKDAQSSTVKGAKFYKIIIIFKWLSTIFFFFMSDVRNVTNFTTGLQSNMSPIIKKKKKNQKFIN